MAANGFLLVQFGDLWQRGKLTGHGPIFALGIVMCGLAIGCAYGMLMHTKKNRLSWWLEKLALANLIGVIAAFAWEVSWL
jgi:hypothetical protein